MKRIAVLSMVMGLIMLVLAPAAWAEEALVDPGSGQPGTSVLLFVSGFEPDVPIQVRFGADGTVLADGNSGDLGMAGIPITIPMGASVGVHVVVVCGFCGSHLEVEAGTTFEVTHPPIGDMLEVVELVDGDDVGTVFDEVESAEGEGTLTDLIGGAVSADGEVTLDDLIGGAESADDGGGIEEGDGTMDGGGFDPPADDGGEAEAADDGGEAEAADDGDQALALPFLAESQGTSEFSDNLLAWLVLFGLSGLLLGAGAMWAFRKN